MAKYLLIEFDSDESCDKLRDRMDKATEGGANYRVTGEFKVPVEWCSCERPKGYKKGEVARGKKYGWHIHAECRKARKGTHQLTNLIPIGNISYRAAAKYVMRVSSVNVFEVLKRNIK
ncbi:MAG: hypothetical protein LC687_05300 [Actinobacteria bacterium]|nr:hypothetical protein [Actinomycetota bacterium]MCA1807249.1 hypothetical protein [Actinomycetota bacterium]